MTYIPIQAKSYISHVPSSVKASHFPLTTMDVKMLEGYQTELPVFKDVSMEDIAFISKRLNTINLFRGCRWGCSHCLKNALAPKSGRETILYEDLKHLVFGFSTLSERLGFNVLNGNKHINIVDDSNPMDMKIRGLKRKHSVVEAMKMIYQKLNIPTLFVTSGWTDRNLEGFEYGLKTAKNIVKMVKDDKDSVKEVQISINPFMDVQNYADRMARTMFAFLDLFKANKASIIYKHTKDEKKGFDENAAKKIYEEIYEKLQQLADSKLEDFPRLKPEIVTFLRASHWIEPSGRAKSFFTEKENLKLQKEFRQDSLDWGLMSKEKQREILLNRALKCVDIDGSIYTIKPSSAEYVNIPIEITIPTDIKLNFINKEKPNPIYSEIEI